MSTVRFTQFIRPNGKRREIQLTVDEETKIKATMLQEDGYNFEIEILRDDVTVSMEVCKEDEEGEIDTLSLRLVTNGPLVPQTVQEMIDEAFVKKFINNQK